LLLCSIQNIYLHTAISGNHHSFDFETVAMAPVTNWMLNSKKEENCISITLERKYYHVGNVFIKRNLQPSEWQTNPRTGSLFVPKQIRERTLNEAATLKYISKNTQIPVPKLICSFEDGEVVYLVMEYVEGIRMDELDEPRREIVAKELEKHLNTLHKITSDKFGGPSGLVSISCSIAPIQFSNSTHVDNSSLPCDPRSWP
jgi:serine/threonine protein kinase